MGCRVSLIGATVLASGSKRRHAPINAIIADTHAYIPAECLPPDLEIKDPRNMSRATLQLILCHWYKRQEESGAESAFRFLRYVGKKNKLHLAEYSSQVDENGNGGDSHDTAKAKSKRDKKRQVEQLDGLLPIEHTQAELSQLDNPGAGPSMARIGAEQMRTLRDQGFEGIGPFNGPNDGLPEYEVPNAWLQLLPIQDSSVLVQPITAGSSSILPQPDMADHRQPQARPILPTNIDPSLLLPTVEEYHPRPIPRASSTAIRDEDTATLAVSMLSAVEHSAVTEPEPEPEPEPQSTPKKGLGK